MSIKVKSSGFLKVRWTLLRFKYCRCVGYTIFPKTHQNAHNSVKYEVIWKWHFVMFIHKQHWISLACISGHKWIFQLIIFRIFKFLQGLKTNLPKALLCLEVFMIADWVHKPAKKELKDVQSIFFLQFHCSQIMNSLCQKCEKNLHFHSNLDLVIPFLPLNLSSRLGFLKLAMMLYRMMMFL